MNKIKIEILIVVRVVGVIENSKSLVDVIFVCIVRVTLTHQIKIDQL